MLPRMGVSGQLRRTGRRHTAASDNPASLWWWRNDQTLLSVRSSSSKMRDARTCWSISARFLWKSDSCAFVNGRTEIFITSCKIHNGVLFGDRSRERIIRWRPVRTTCCLRLIPAHGILAAWLRRSRKCTGETASKPKQCICELLLRNQQPRWALMEMTELESCANRVLTNAGEKRAGSENRGHEIYGRDNYLPQ